MEGVILLKINVKYYQGEWDNGAPAQVIEMEVVDKEDFYTDKIFSPTYEKFERGEVVYPDAESKATIKMRFNTFEKAQLFEKVVKQQVDEIVTKNRERVAAFVSEEKSLNV
jgi:tRNA U34 2-thiouridine synthase MnmA/TrmU